MKKKKKVERKDEVGKKRNITKYNFICIMIKYNITQVVSNNIIKYDLTKYNTLSYRKIQYNIT